VGVEETRGGARIHPLTVWNSKPPRPPAELPAGGPQATTRVATLITKSTLPACVLAGNVQHRSFDDRSSSRPADPTRAETSRGPLIEALVQRWDLCGAGNLGKKLHCLTRECSSRGTREPSEYPQGRTPFARTAGSRSFPLQQRKALKKFRPRPGEYGRNQRAIRSAAKRSTTIDNSVAKVCRDGGAS
jgi:hypothetical protein